MTSMFERELKLEPLEPDLLDRLATLDRLGSFRVVDRRTELQRNSFFDSRGGALGAARLALRRRCVPGCAMATWTLKGEGALDRGIASRPEIEVQLSADMPPAMVLGTLVQAARERGATALAEETADALVGSAPILARPFLESQTLRRVLDLRDDQAGVELELALDQVKLVDHPSFTEQEIEVELRRGDESVLEQARKAITALGQVRDGRGSKLSRALDHVRGATCSCAGGSG
jgi:inorganic triphosphatase YgiF